MSVESELIERCGSRCELCAATGDLVVCSVDPNADQEAGTCVMICGTCSSQIQDPDSIQPNHWRCLNESIWSQTPAVQVMSWRLLNRLRSEGWVRDLMETIDLPADIVEWAAADGSNDSISDTPTSDCNGTTLHKGDTVTLIKDLVVKGGGFTAKRGTTVKNIALSSNPKYVEGRVNGTQIVLVSAFLKKVT